MSVQIIGLEDVLKSLGDLADDIPSSAGDGARAAAEAAKVVIQNEAPRRTGKLRESIVAGGFKKKQGKPVAAFVRVDRKKAPHAHLVEFGARAGAMPANPFFARGVAKVKGGAIDDVEAEINAAIDRIWK